MLRRRKLKGRAYWAARARAPKHPKAPESWLRIATAKLFALYHARVKKAALSLAHPFRTDAANDGEWKNAQQYFDRIFHNSPFKHIVKKAATKTAASAVAQTSKALQHSEDFDADAFDPNMQHHAVDMAAEIVSGIDSRSAESIERAQDILEEWRDLDPDYSPRAGDLDALDDMLEDGLSGIEGAALASLALTFSAAFADMVESSQKDAGAESYVWMSQRDSKTRPAHLALDGAVASWDEPPLSAEDADNEEDCHAGDDFNCRCVASPIMPGEDLSEWQAERV